MNDKFVDMPKCMADKYETADFISSDPVQFPRRYSGRDAEVSGFITSAIKDMVSVPMTIEQ